VPEFLIGRLQLTAADAMMTPPLVSPDDKPSGPLMSYLSDFEHSFVDHTLKVLQSYDGEFDATILVNCLLGLLVVPKESFLNAIPEEPLAQLHKWGIEPDSIKSPGRPTKANPNPATLRGLVVNLRHAVAHFKIEPIPATSHVHSFRYTNESGLEAVVSLKEMRAFVRALAMHLDKS
jgi:hypothetical protein